ncbi:MAG: hypothetical protein EBT33_01785 [Betaproteobacteria bacterium]|nr:hypothetical protein [Betaproteobacteria bacterium]
MTFIRLTNSKALGSVDPSDPVLPAEDAAAWFEASQLLDHAREEAAQLLGSARQQLEAERARGYQQGLEEARLEPSELLEQFPGVGILDIVADPRLKQDATILESEIGLVEASIESQLQAIEQGFQKVLGSRV